MPPLDFHDLDTLTGLDTNFRPYTIHTDLEPYTTYTTTAPYTTDTTTTFDYFPRNYTEFITEDKLESIIRKICKTVCEHVQLDITADELIDIVMRGTDDE